MYYFAYGSNMNHKQMKQRCPNSKFITKAKLNGYRFIYDGYSSSRQGAVANIIESENDSVWGGLFEISDKNLSGLDRYEGYPTCYNREKVVVSDESANKYEAIVYFRIGKPSGQPSKEYLDVVIQGAKDCGLSEEYINKVLMR